MVKGFLLFLLLTAFIPNHLISAEDPNAIPPGNDSVVAPVVNGFGIAIPLHITPNNFCEEKASENAYSCLIPGVSITQIQRHSQVAAGVDNPARETLEIMDSKGTKIRIHAGENGSPILESCERMAMKANNSQDNPPTLGVAFQYSRSAPNLASRIGKPNEVDIVLDPNQGPVKSLRCYLIFPFKWNPL